MSLTTTRLLATVSRGVKPAVAWLTVNRACNLRCDWCYARGTEYENELDMPLSLARDLIYMIKSLGIRSVIIIGGEPTLWSPLLEFNHFLKNEGLKSTLVTNGTRFGKDQFWNEYCQIPNTKIGLSIKGYDDSSFSSVTRTKKFNLTKLGIERALQITGGGASIVYSGHFTEEIVELAKFAVACGAKSLVISPSTPAYVNGSPETNGVAVPSAFIDGIIENYPFLDKLFGGRINVSVKLPLCIWPKEFVMRLIEKSQITTTCQLHHRSGLIFDTDGTLISCNSLADFPLGRLGSDFSDTKSLLKYLSSSSVVKFYDKVTSYPAYKCSTCSMYEYCAGGCPLFYGVYNANDLICGWD